MYEGFFYIENSLPLRGKQSFEKENTFYFSLGVSHPHDLSKLKTLSLITKIKTLLIGNERKYKMNEKRNVLHSWFQAQMGAGSIASLLMKPDQKPKLGERALGPFILPDFQRPPSWTKAQKVRLIESIWAGLPIGSYVLNQTGFERPCDNWLLDGQQRIKAVLSYLEGNFKVYGEKFTDLSVVEQRDFKMRPFYSLVTRVEDRDRCKEIYMRLAYGGTPHRVLSKLEI
jgi:hypothetical protein